MRKPLKRFAQIAKLIRDFCKRISKPFKRFTRSVLNGC